MTPIKTDVFDTVGGMINSAETVALAAGVLIAVILVVLMAWRSKGALGGVVSAFIVGLLIIFAVNNVDNAEVQQQITDTVVPNGQDPVLVPAESGTGV